MNAANPVVVELFTRGGLESRDLESTETAANKLNQAKKAAEAEVTRLKSLGLDEQANIFRADQLAPIISASYEKMSLRDTQIQIWKEFLPESYSKRAGDWKKYRLDVIPEKVISEIVTIEETGYFDDMEIWTPEGVQTDPLLVGVLDDKRFLIARWGESLLDFEEITIRMAAKRTYWISFSKLNKPVQQFIVDKYRENPEVCFFIENGLLTWHCMTPTRKVIVSHQRERGGMAYSVCRKCGSFSDGKRHMFSYDYL